MSLRHVFYVDILSYLMNYQWRTGSFLKDIELLDIAHKSSPDKETVYTTSRFRGYPISLVSLALVMTEDIK